MAKKRKQQETHVHITPAGLETLAKEIWGDQWRAKFSEVTGISYSQLHRYMTVYNGQMIPQVVVVALEALRLLKGPADEPIVSIGPYRKPIAEAIPVKFVQEKKPRPARIDNDAPIVDFFGLGSPAPAPAETKAPEPETPPPAPEPTPGPEPAPKPAKAPKKAVAKEGKAGPETGKGKAGTGKAKAPAAKPKEPAKAKAPAAPKKAAPKRPALAKA